VAKHRGTWPNRVGEWPFSKSNYSHSCRLRAAATLFRADLLVRHFRRDSLYLRQRLQLAKEWQLAAIDLVLAKEGTLYGAPLLAATVRQSALQETAAAFIFRIMPIG
jgi:hypothetical protein